jgi:hypothetical protein
MSIHSHGRPAKRTRCAVASGKKRKGMLLLITFASYWTECCLLDVCF